MLFKLTHMNSSTVSTYTSTCPLYTVHVLCMCKYIHFKIYIFIKYFHDTSSLVTIVSIIIYYRYNFISLKGLRHIFPIDHLEWVSDSFRIFKLIERRGGIYQYVLSGVVFDVSTYIIFLEREKGSKQERDRERSKFSIHIHINA